MPVKVSDIKCALMRLCLAVPLCIFAAGANHAALLDRIAQFDFCGLDAVLEDSPPFGVGMWMDSDRRPDVFYGERLSYRVKGDGRMLHSGGINRKKDSSPWGVFIPCVEPTGGIPTDEVWFASSYSHVRKELYSKGSVQDSYPMYRCYMRGRAVYRGGGASPNESGGEVD